MQFREDRTDSRMVFGRDPAIDVPLALVVPRERGVDGQCVGIVDGMMHRADERAAVHVRCEAGQMLADRDGRERRGDRLKLAANFGGLVGLHVPGVEVAGAAVEKQHDDMIGPRRLGGCGPLGIGPEQRRQGEARQTGRTGGEQFPAGELRERGLSARQPIRCAPTHARPLRSTTVTFPDKSIRFDIPGFGGAWQADSGDALLAE